MYTTPAEAIFACSIALFNGKVLQARDVTVGNGLLIDWRFVKSGQEIANNLEVYDAACLFVEMVGPSTATEAVQEVM